MFLSLTEYSCLFPLSVIDFPSQIIFMGLREKYLQGLSVLVDPMTLGALWKQLRLLSIGNTRSACYCSWNVIMWSFYWNLFNNFFFLRCWVGEIDCLLDTKDEKVKKMYTRKPTEVPNWGELHWRCSKILKVSLFTFYP